MANSNIANQMYQQQRLHQHIPSSSGHDNHHQDVARLPPSPLSSPTSSPSIVPISNIMSNAGMNNAGMTRPKSESKAEVARLKQEYKQYVDDLLEWTSAQENLDVYQLNAFFGATHEMRYYWRNYWKTICVQFIQTFGLVILLYHDWLVGTVQAELNENGGTKAVCATNGEWDLKLLSFFLLSFLSIRLSDQIATMADYGMYSWGQNPITPHFVNWGWIAYGLMVNYITLVFSFFISGLVVYNASTPLDMILDFVALYFIIELDDEMVTHKDYQDIEEWLRGNDTIIDEENLKTTESPYDVWLYNVAIGNDKGLSAGVVDDDNDGYDDDTISGKCGSLWNKCGIKILKCGGKCRDPRIARNVMLPLVILMPVYVLICF